MFAAKNTAAPSGEAVYIESVFSTYLYTGTSGAQTINNGIDLSGKGGLLWVKNRGAVVPHVLLDTARGSGNYLSSNSTSSQQSIGALFSSFNNNGFTVGVDNGSELLNANTKTYVSWTFREQPKFFDVVTWTGNGTSPRAISHSLGSVPGCIIAKSLSTTGNWFVYHRSIGATKDLRLNGTNAETTTSASWGDTAPTSTQFTVGGNSNVNNETFVAYLFAHNAGGFGAAGTDNVITCGSFTTDGSGNWTASLGFEPQWILHKPSSATGDWLLVDNMRGWTTAGTAGDAYLYPNTSAAEFVSTQENISPNATGMSGATYAANTTYIYIAIRRGPMRPPSTGTSVFGDISALEPVSTNQTTENGVLADLVVNGVRINQGGFGPHWLSRLTGNGNYLISSSTVAEATQNFWKFDNNNFAYIPPSGYANNDSTAKYVAYSFKRAPGFFDVVCYTGTGANRTVTHNLGVVPEMMIVKRRSGAGDWPVYHVAMGATKYTFLDGSTELTSNLYWNDTAPTASVFTVGTTYRVNQSGDTYVAYLFASVSGVSKVGSYTGTGTTQTINCGFSAGARFILIHRIDSGSNDWYVWDSARGIVSGNDPYLLINTTAAEVTNTDYIDPANSGFEISSTAPAAINANGGTFIFLAIA